MDSEPEINNSLLSTSISPEGPAPQSIPQPLIKKRFYVCPTCNEIVNDPERDIQKKNTLRCHYGHEAFQSGLPFLSAITIGTIIAFILCIGTFFLAYVVPFTSVWLAIIRVVSVLYFVYQLFRGVLWLTRSQPTRGLGVSTVGMNLGFLIGIGVAVLAWLKSGLGK
jgi:hypothetical protein